MRSFSIVWVVFFKGYSTWGYLSTAPKCDTLTPGGVQSLSYIAEGDLYRLIIHSKLPSAEKFEHWVFEEVLPCIRKTGGYMTDNLLNELINEPDIIYKVTSDMLKERGQRMRLEGEVKAAKPKVEYSHAKDHNTNEQEERIWLQVI